MAIQKGDRVWFELNGAEQVGKVAAVKYLIRFGERYVWVESGEVRKVPE